MQLLSILVLGSAILHGLFACLLAALSWTLLAAAADIVDFLSNDEPRSREGNRRFTIGRAKNPALNRDSLAEKSVRNIEQLLPRTGVNISDSTASRENCRSSGMISGDSEEQIRTKREAEENGNDIKQRRAHRVDFDKENESVRTQNLRGMSSLQWRSHLEEEFDDTGIITNGISMDPRDENYAKGAIDRLIEFAMLQNVAGSEKNPERGNDEDQDPSMNRALASKFLSSILKRTSLFRTDGEESEIDFPGSQETPPGKPSPGTQGKILGNDSAVPDLFIGPSILSINNRKVYSREENDQRQRSGLDPSTAADRVNEKSASSTAESRFEEGKEDPSVSKRAPLNGTCSTDSAIVIRRRQPIDRGREEQELNAMIRRMILSELKRHRETTQTGLKKAYSDTESVAPGRRHRFRTRIGASNPKGRTFFRDLLELEESMRANDDGSKSRPAAIRRGEGTAEAADRREPDRHSSVDRSRKSNDPGKIVERTIESDISLERKDSLPCLAAGSTEIVESGAASEAKIRADKSTQTEHARVIRAIRSCPLRETVLPLQFQLRHPASDREATSPRTVFASLDSARFVFRKASDNLIYEKGKGSGSPGYVSSPERFHWKYLLPSRT